MNSHIIQSEIPHQPKTTQKERVQLPRELNILESIVREDAAQSMNPHLPILNIIILTNSQSHFSANIVLRAVKESAHLIAASLVAMCPYVCVHVSVVS